MKMHCPIDFKRNSSVTRRLHVRLAVKNPAPVKGRAWRRARGRDHSFFAISFSVMSSQSAVLGARPCANLRNISFTSAASRVCIL